MYTITVIVVSLVTTIGFQSYVVDAFHHRQVIIPVLHSSILSTRSFSTRSTSTSLAEHTLHDDAITCTNDGEKFMEEDGPKAQLLKAQLLKEISIIRDGSTTTTTNDDDDDDESTPIRFRYGDSKTRKSKIDKYAKDLSGYALPRDNRKASQWKLLYTTAPCILGCSWGSYQLISVQQTIMPERNTIDLDLEYKPTTFLHRSIFDDERLKQTVRFDYKIGSMNTVNLQLIGFCIKSSYLSCNSINDGILDNNPNKNLISRPNALPPFVDFTIVFNDGDLRIDRTIQGDYLSIYKKKNEIEWNEIEKWKQ